MGPPGTSRARKTRSRVTETSDASPRTGPLPSVALDDPKLLVDRDLSLLQFQRRVLEEARDESNPLLERVKFLSILGSNLDEFFMFRAPLLKQQAAAGVIQLDPEGLTPAAHLERIRSQVSLLMAEARQHLHDRLIPALAAAGIHVLSYQDLRPKEREEANAHFTEAVLPLLMPLAFDPVRPFPHVSNLGLNLGVLIRDRKGVERFAQVKLPETLPRIVPVTFHRKRSGRGRSSRRQTLQQCYVWLEQVITANLGALFPGVEIIEAHPFRVTRDAEITTQEWKASELLDGTEEGVRRRHFGTITRLAVGDQMPPRLLAILTQNFNHVGKNDVYPTRRPLALSRLLELSRIDRPDLHDPPFSPRIPPALADSSKGGDIFRAIRQGDLLLHHPYDSFQTVLDFLQQAADDPDVLTIKVTLYRLGRHPPVVKALLDARRNGKEVGVVVELKARFDEESNVGWARALERAGVHVVYGLVDFKVHAKIALVVRREGGRIRRYVHLSSGNYNAVTAKTYTDLGLLSCNEELGADATDFFNYLTGYSAPAGFRKLIVAPISMRDRLRGLIRRELSRHQPGEPGRLIFKMNALADQEMIQLLYQASQAGVQVDLLVRGVCCLRPGVPGVSDNIRVRSIVGRFLEHSRIYYFRNGGAEEIYVGSADLTPHNLDRRVEVLFPVEDLKLARRLRDEILALSLADNIKARRLLSDGAYVRITPGLGETAVSSQQQLLPTDDRGD